MSRAKVSADEPEALERVEAMGLTLSFGRTDRVVFYRVYRVLLSLSPVSCM